MITNIYQLPNTGQQFICSNQFYVYWKYKRWVLLLFILQLKNKKKKKQNLKRVLTILMVTWLINGQPKIQTQIFLTSESKYSAIFLTASPEWNPSTSFLSTSSSLSRMRNRCVHINKCKWRTSGWSMEKGVSFISWFTGSSPKTSSKTLSSVFAHHISPAQDPHPTSLNLSNYTATLKPMCFLNLPSPWQTWLIKHEVSSFSA